MSASWPPPAPVLDADPIAFFRTEPGWLRFRWRVLRRRCWHCGLRPWTMRHDRLCDPCRTLAWNGRVPAGNRSPAQRAQERRRVAFEAERPT